jgi:hypothetical protein
LLGLSLIIFLVASCLDNQCIVPQTLPRQPASTVIMHSVLDETA